MSESASLVLTLPPSSNHMFVNKARGGRFKSQEYDAWQKSAAWRIKAQRPGKVSGLVIVEYSIGWKGVVGSADLSNRVKALEDALVAGKVIDDDRFVECYSVRRDRTTEDVYISVMKFFGDAK